MQTNSPIRIVVVDDHDVVRKGLSTFIAAYSEFLLVGEAKNGQQAIELCQRLHPDIVLMDLLMHDTDGIAATKVIRHDSPSTQVVVLTSYNDEGLVQQALQAGAIGYMMKTASIDELANSIRAAATGNATLSPEAARSLIAVTVRPKPSDFNLSNRELEILKLLVEGLKNPEIADMLFVSRSTVKFHVSAILSKLNVSTRTEAVAMAIQFKLVK